MTPDQRQLSEDQLMLASQTVCGTCNHRFTTPTDWEFHDMLIHQKQPSPAEIMTTLEVAITLLEQILVTVSR